jgi:hypothetical protein
VHTLERALVAFAQKKSFEIESDGAAYELHAVTLVIGQKTVGDKKKNFKLNKIF